MHARLKPMRHRFSYRVMSLLIDLDRLDEADRQSPLFGVNRRGALQLPRSRSRRRATARRLRAYAQRCAAEHGIDLTGGRVLLLCYPRLLGYTFNPLSVYYCYRADGALALLIYEVRNTFGEIHPYVLPVQPGEISDAGVRQQQDKLFYVSPFIEMAMRYHFRVTPAGGARQAAHSGDRRGRPAARRDLQRPPPRPDHGGAAAVVLLAAARDVEDHGGDPLGGACGCGSRAPACCRVRNCSLRTPAILATGERNDYTQSALPTRALIAVRSTTRTQSHISSMDLPCPS